MLGSFRSLRSKPQAEFGEADLIINKDGSVYHLNLCPEHIADTIIAVGDPGRVHAVSAFFDSVEFEMNHREFVTHTGQYKGRRITVMSTGMGTDNIEIFINELDALVNIDLETRRRKEQHTSLKIVRVGTSGSIQPQVPLGSLVASEYAIGLDTLMFFYQLPQTEFEAGICQSLREAMDFPFTPYCVEGNQGLLQKIGHDMVKGNTITSPGFYAPQGRKLRYELRYPDMLDQLCHFHQNNFWLTNFEMETAGYYALGRILGHECLSVSAIIANRAENKFSTSPKKVVDRLIGTVLDRL